MERVGGSGKCEGLMRGKRSRMKKRMGFTITKLILKVNFFSKTVRDKKVITKYFVENIISHPRFSSRQ